MARPGPSACDGTNTARMRRVLLCATYDSAPFDFHRLSGKKTYTEVDTLPDRFGSRSQVLDHKSISLRISWVMATRVVPTSWASSAHCFCVPVCSKSCGVFVWSLECQNSAVVSPFSSSNRQRRCKWH